MMRTCLGLILLLLILGFMLFPSVHSWSSTSASNQAAPKQTTQQSQTGPFAPAEIFTVNSILDTPDAVPGNNSCDDGVGNCTLRAAIMEANALVGPDTINFNIAPGGPQTIAPTGAFPVIVDTLTINGNTQPGSTGAPIIELNGGGVTGLSFVVFQTSNSTLRGVVVNRKDGNGVVLSGNNNRVLNCFIGTDLSGLVAGPGNAIAGVFIAGTGNVVGGLAPGEPNIIGFNSFGVVVQQGSGNSILSNSIDRNFSLGLDLGFDGVTANDACDPDTGPNGLQNFPMLTGAQTNLTILSVQGTLDSNASGTYRIEFFSNEVCHPSGNGEGGEFIGATTVATDASCNASFNVTFPVAVAPNIPITATATSSANNTSEFSQCVSAVLTDCNIECPGNITQGNDTNQCGAVVNYPPPITTGNCETVTCNPPAGSFFPRGATTVTCTTQAGPGCSFTITVNDTQAPGITCPGPVNAVTADPGGTTVTYPAPNATDNCPGVASSCSPPSGSNFPVGTTTVTCTATDTSANNTGCVFDVTVTLVACTITCPANVVRTNDRNLCNAVVSYPAPVTAGGSCGAVTCIPPSGSTFPVGATIVLCTTEVGASCSFNVTVTDNEPPQITCPASVVAPLPAGQLSTVVNYPAPAATDNCSAVSVTCSPPSGASFPAGITFVTCGVADSFTNFANCIFSVTVLDAELPVVRCPANVTIDVPSTQCNAVVTYPAATVVDNLPGATVACVPASGSVFPVGVSTVTCTATDVAGNRASCSFSVSLTGGAVQAVFSPTSVDIRPVSLLSSKARKRTKTEAFSILNTGCGALRLTLRSVRRVTDQSRFANPDDTAFFSVFRRGPDGGATGPNLIGQQVTINQGSQETFIVRFSPMIPDVTGGAPLSAVDVVPSAFQSMLVLDGIPNTVTFNVRVKAGVKLIDPVNPQNAAIATICRSGDQFIVRYWLYDSDKSDVRTVKYEFLDGSGNVVSVIDNVDLAGPLNQSPILSGQSFSVENAFTGANSNSGVAAVRVTVFGGNSSDTVTSGPIQSTCAATSAQSFRSQVRFMRLPVLKLDVVKP